MVYKCRNVNKYYNHGCMCFTAQFCMKPDPPVNGDMECFTDASSGTMYCNITCKRGKAFLEPVPRQYICRQEGLWDPPRGSTFSFPACAGKKHNLNHWS